eukprot:2751738-Prymnesium_polylepis.1
MGVVQSCWLQCATCPRCRFLSIDARSGRCEWSTRCDRLHNGSTASVPLFRSARAPVWRDAPNISVLSIDDSESGPLDAEAFTRANGSLQLARRWLDTAMPGYCAPTSAGVLGDCANGEQGTFPVASAVGWLSLVHSCWLYCAQCTQCRFLSLSVEARDCSWYRHCTTAKLHTDLTGFRSGRAHAAVEALPRRHPAGGRTDGTASLAPTGELAEGAWEPADAVRRLPYLADVSARHHPHCDAVQHDYLTLGRVPSYLRWTWRPSARTLVDAEPAAYCHVLRRVARKTAAVADRQLVLGLFGDSMMEQLFQSLLGVLLGLSHHWGHAYPTKRHILAVPVCGGAVRLLWARRDHFDAHTLALLAAQADLLVLNWGVHYTDDVVVAAQMAVAISVLERAWGGKPRSHVFWRASLAAHAACSREGGGAQGAPGGRATPDNGNGSAIATQWKAREVLEQDQRIAWPLVRRFGGRVLRVDALTLPRSDGHRVDGPGRWVDCLHFCLPGVPDAWGQLLMTELVTPAGG